MSDSQSVQVKRGVAGLGLFATQPFKRGDFIIEYIGDMIDRAEADRRGGKYLFTVTADCIIDGKGRTNIARYINHACRPNAYAEADVDELKIRMYAKKKILPGEEIFCHYGQEYFKAFLGAACQCPYCKTTTN